MLATTRDPLRATSALAAGLPKAARFGREAFAAHLSRALAARDIVVFDARVLRRLDRIDTVVVDASLLTTGRVELGEIVPVGGAELANVGRRAESMFRLDSPRDVRRHGGWVLAPLEHFGADAAFDGAAEVLSRLTSSSATILGLAQGGSLRAVATVVPELDPFALALRSRIGFAGCEFVVAGKRTDGVAAHVGASRSVPGGGYIGSSIRALQRDGRGVAYVSSRSHAGLVAADCGIGVDRPGVRAPWGADLIVPADLASVCFVIDAIGAAAAVSRRSARVALAG